MGYRNSVANLANRNYNRPSIEQFATRVFEQWQLGKKGKDNGVLVIVVPKDRKMRIEVGYGLEGPLTDVASSRIIRNDMTPRVKTGDYDGGIEAGVKAIFARIDAGPEVAGAATGAKSFVGDAMNDINTIEEPQLPP